MLKHWSPLTRQLHLDCARSLHPPSPPLPSHQVLWAFGKLKHYDRVLFLRLLGAVAAKLPHFLPQGVSNVAWALAAVGHRDPALFDQLVGHCLAEIGSYDVQGLSNL